MLTGFDVPLELEARVELPPGARLLDPPRTGEAARIPPSVTLAFTPGQELKALLNETRARKP